MVDYSKFDSIDTDSEEETHHPAPSSMINSVPQKLVKKGKEGRLKFEYDGRTIYEWEQNMTEVNLYFDLPSGIDKKMLDIAITHHHLRVGLKNTNPFLDEDTGGPIKPGESMWTVLDGELNINLQKMNKAEAWNCALKGRTEEKLDAFTQEEVRKKLLLERFQEEHPGFDFSGAEFNGQVPDARDFMGGVKHF